ncbi:MAG: VCBS repeat-containing protein [Ignavibacteria bacterium]|nr:VCBS repeat-containing protein [Ignavibacteria bacterium]
MKKFTLLKIAAIILPFLSVTNIFSQQFEKTNINIEALSHGKVNWIDLNNDGKLDVFISGNEDSGISRTLIYLNQGNENFVLINHGIPDFSNAKISWEDYDKDNDIDLLISGVENDGKYYNSDLQK